MRVCFITDQIFKWGLKGGFGKLTWDIGKNLAKKGIEVFIVCPQNEGQRTIEYVEDMIIMGSPISSRIPFSNIFSKKFYKLCDADIYHSEQPYINSYIAMRAMHDKKHIMTFQDPRNENDWELLIKAFPEYKKTYKKNSVQDTIRKYVLYKAIHSADALFCQAKYIIPKVQKIYALEREPVFLPNPVEIPNRNFKKDEEPTVCFLGRLDEIKRPEIFCELSKRFPEVKFIVMGGSNNPEYFRTITKKYSTISNLIFKGWTYDEEKCKILEQSWISVNTSIYECLPVSFLEASAHKCAILSSVNPDNFASDFGYHVMNDDYEQGLGFLLEDERWKERGEKGYEYVKQVHELNKAIEQHIQIYKKLVEE